MGGKSDVWERAQTRAVLPLKQSPLKAPAAPSATALTFPQPQIPAPVLSAHGGLDGAFLLRPCPTGIFGAPGWVCPAVTGDQGREAAASFRR